jgi:hypothetical protein
MNELRLSKRAVAVFVAMLVTAAVAVAANWVMLGERVVNDRAEMDTITVTGAQGRFTALKVKVMKRPVHFIDMKVYFGDDSTQDVELRTVIPAGGETRVIDLEGGKRIVTKVEFTYEAESIGRGRKAAVHLLGRR